jgi:hypothetical protein
LFGIGNCTNKKIEPVPVPTSVLVPTPAQVIVPVPVRAPVPVPVPVPPVPVQVPVPPVPVREPVSPTKTPTKAPTKAPTNAPTKSPTKAPTNAPTKAPTNALITQSLLTSFINNITLSNRTIAANGLTPEDRALNYLIVNDTTFNFTQLLTLNSMMTNMVQFRICQRYALLTLWFQQVFTNTSWTRRNGWLVNADECSWFHITCAPINLGGTVGTQNVVTAVCLNFNNMKGTIPADLGLLTALKYLDVGFNALTGTLPVSIGQWTALTVFGVAYNALTGTLPASIGSWNQIQAAFFQDNQFTGTMPDGICPYINATISEQLQADCKSEVNCTCCTLCY